jgi:hypothetical protein
MLREETAPPEPAAIMRTPTARMLEHKLRDNDAQFARTADTAGGIVWSTLRTASVYGAKCSPEWLRHGSGGSSGGRKYLPPFTAKIEGRDGYFVIACIACSRPRISHANPVRRLSEKCVSSDNTRPRKFKSPAVSKPPILTPTNIYRTVARRGSRKARPARA